MSKGVLLARLMGQPYDVANILAASSVTRLRVVATYIVIALAGSGVCVFLYGILTVSL